MGPGSSPGGTGAGSGVGVERGRRSVSVRARVRETGLLVPGCVVVGALLPAGRGCAVAFACAVRGVGPPGCRRGVGSGTGAGRRGSGGAEGRESCGGVVGGAAACWAGPSRRGCWSGWSGWSGTARLPRTLSGRGSGFGPGTGSGSSPGSGSISGPGPGSISGPNSGSSPGSICRPHSGSGTSWDSCTGPASGVPTTTVGVGDGNATGSRAVSRSSRVGRVDGSFSSRAVRMSRKGPAAAGRSGSS